MKSPSKLVFATIPARSVSSALCTLYNHQTTVLPFVDILLYRSGVSGVIDMSCVQNENDELDDGDDGNDIKGHGDGNENYGNDDEGGEDEECRQIRPENISGG